MQRLTAEWAEIQRVVSSEKAAASAAARALDEATKAADKSRAKAEADLAGVTKAKDLAEQHAAIAEGKVEILSTSLKKVGPLCKNPPLQSLSISSLFPLYILSP